MRKIIAPSNHHEKSHKKRAELAGITPLEFGPD